MRETEIELIAERVSDVTVTKTFKALGLDINDSEDIRHFQANMAWVFRFRRLSERIGTTVIVTVFTVLTGGILKLAYEALKSKTGGS